MLINSREICVSLHFAPQLNRFSQPHIPEKSGFPSARRLERASADVVDEPESARELAIRAPRGGRKDIGPGRVLQLQSVKDVLEVHPDGERHPFLEPEDAPQTHRFRRPSLITIVIIV